MKNAILFGYGNIGKELVRQLPKEKIDLKYIVNSNGVFDSTLVKQGDLGDWKSFTDNIDVVFITIPTIGDGKVAFEYASFFLLKNIPVITCEKASIANNFDFFKKFKNFFKYTASVGGGTKMLNKISDFRDKILEMKAVVNGTLNFIGSSLKKGIDKNEIVKDVLEKGYAEPGANSFEEIINGELQDVKLKTVILSNHSGIFDRIIKLDDIKIIRDDLNKRCVVKISKQSIEAGFLEDNNANWLPVGVDNVLYINGKKVCFGPGAGAAATAKSMIFDMNSLV